MTQQLVPLTIGGQASPIMGERGMTTAEYAVGVIAVIALVGVFIAIIMGGDFAAAVNPLVLEIVNTISGALVKVK